MSRILILALVGLFAVGCKMGKNYSGTTLDMPTAFAQIDSTNNMQVESIKTDTLVVTDTIGINWWTLYDDPVLDSLIETAMRRNRSALVAAENIMQARIAIKIQNADFAPKIAASGIAERSTLFINQILDVENLFIGQASVFWEIDVWGRLRRLSEAARHEWLASEYGYKSMMISLISEVTTTYFSLIEARENIEISERNLALRDSMLHIIEQRFDRGIIPMIDVNQAQIQKAIAAAAVPQFKRKEAQLQNALSVLVGYNPTYIATPTALSAQNSQVEIQLYKPREIVKRRPDVVAAENTLIAQNARFGAAQASRLPMLSVFGAIGFVGSNDPTFSIQNPLYNFGLQLAGPIIYWGQLKRAAMIQESRGFQSLYQYENVVLNALREVEDVLIEIETLQEEISIAQYRLTAALNAQKLSGDRYTQGVTSYLEYLEAQRQAFDAELALTRVRQQFLSAKMKLYKALGGGNLMK